MTIGQSSGLIGNLDPCNKTHLTVLKYKAVPLRIRYEGHTYRIGDCVLATEKELEVIVDQQLSMNSQCNAVVHRSDAILGCIKGINE